MGLANRIASGFRMVVRLLSTRRVNLGQIGNIHVSAFQTACRRDDVQPIRQRVLVPVNVIEGAVHLLIVLSRGSHAGLAEIDTEAPRLTMQPGERLTSVMAIGSQYPMARPGRTKAVAAPDTAAGDYRDCWYQAGRLYQPARCRATEREDAAPAHIGDRVNKPALT
jgi:hypothetical protein